MRHMKMAEWMENVEKSIARIMADKVYTSAEFKRERDTFNVSFILATTSLIKNGHVLVSWLTFCSKWSSNKNNCCSKWC